MGSADDGHAPLLQGFGDFRNGGAKLPLPVLAAAVAVAVPLLAQPANRLASMHTAIRAAEILWIAFIFAFSPYFFLP